MDGRHDVGGSTEAEDEAVIVRVGLASAVRLNRLELGTFAHGR
jgi:hypothetical protein